MTAACTFRVFVYEWTCWDTTLEAETEEAAVEAAQALWDDEGPEAFSLHDNGCDGIQAYVQGEAT